MAVGEHHLSWDEGQALVFDVPGMSRNVDIFKRIKIVNI